MARLALHVASSQCDLWDVERLGSTSCLQFCIRYFEILEVLEFAVCASLILWYQYQYIEMCIFVFL